MDNQHNIPHTIDNELEGMRNRRPADIRNEDTADGSDLDDLGIVSDPVNSEDGSPDQLSAVEQVQATWSPGAPETAFGAVPPENDDEIITARSVRAERDPEEYSQDEDLEALDAHSSLDV
ncbi:MAG: hypothetical protein KF760_20770 [Candidatus Eremiobacteraeota bacterium]|nr:hypothetical protein [Candidatus Eremiobacteraeota bacterium]MCW5871553.1 hypothetical protein [Candidatus Eremiobacteraeota bacterium]